MRRRRPRLSEDLSICFGENQAMKNISMDIPAHSVTAIIGPSGCGKSTFLRCAQPHARAGPRAHA